VNRFSKGGMIRKEGIKKENHRVWKLGIRTGDLVDEHQFESPSRKAAKTPWIEFNDELATWWMSTSSAFFHLCQWTVMGS